MAPHPAPNKRVWGHNPFALNTPSFRVLFILLLTGLIVSITALALPNILHFLGLHPTYRAAVPDMSGKRALILTTSHGTLGQNGPATGVYASELTIPYYLFMDAGMDVDVASVDGGKIPIDPLSLGWPLRTPQDARYRKDADFRQKVASSLPIGDVDVSRYDLIFVSGGWGAAYDLGVSDDVARAITEARALGIPLGAVCHGTLAFLKAREPDNTPLLQGKHVTGVTDRQVDELGILITPMHPETELRQAGAIFESKTAFRDFFATHVVQDGAIVTGQNQNSSAEAAARLVDVANLRGFTP